MITLFTGQPTKYLVYHLKLGTTGIIYKVRAPYCLYAKKLLANLESCPVSAIEYTKLSN